jgi:hypothetical protein
MSEMGTETPASTLAVQTQIYRTMDSVRKLRAVFEMFEFALQMARSGTRMRLDRRASGGRGAPVGDWYYALQGNRGCRKGHLIRRGLLAALWTS